ncbi:MAG TPA: RuBisCO large subunit C-terminal-like domain-containing protein [Acidimicrobiales bacterium]|nr:RuBisCO large subunit C-terminal-like domain-containing protein [Acidimicrobiales bacterium]
MIRATFELEPADVAGVLESLGGAAAEGDDGRVTVDLPVEDWNDDVTLLLAAVVAGEVMELGRLARCRLVELVFPDGLLPGPAFGAPVEDVVGVIVKPALGLSPAQVGDVARAAVAGGARFLKDDEIAGDRASCPLAERVGAVAKALEPGVVYCPNVTGPPLTLLDRARAAVDLGATGLLVDPFAQGLGSLLALREAALGVPIFAHRAGSGPWARNRDFGPTGGVLARLLRLCGADYVIAGGFGGTLFEAEDEVRANLEAIRGPCGPARPAVAALGGGLGPGDVRGQVDAAGPGGLLVLLGSAAYRWPGGLAAAVAAAVGSL